MIFASFIVKNSYCMTTIQCNDREKKYASAQTKTTTVIKLMTYFTQNGIVFLKTILSNWTPFQETLFCI